MIDYQRPVGDDDDDKKLRVSSNKLWPSGMFRLGKLNDLLGFDLRSLACYRFLLGLVIIGDLCDRATNLHAHYTDNGLFPRDLAVGPYEIKFFLNVYLISGTWAITAALFLVHGLIALCFTFGYRTRLSTVLLWLFHNSLLGRNLPVGHGGDMYFRCQLFWIMFLPMGELWSVDAAIRRTNVVPFRKTYKYVSAATVALMLQVSYMYVFAYYLKTHDWWHKDYLAAYHAIRLDYFRTIVGDLFLMFPPLLKFLTYATLQWEFWGPFFYFMPVYTPWFRLFGAVGMMALHVGFGSCLRLGTFLYISVVVQIAFIPSEVWDWILYKLVSRERMLLKVRYPSNCYTCWMTARLLQTFALVTGSDVMPHLHAGGASVKYNLSSGEKYSDEDIAVARPVLHNTNNNIESSPHMEKPDSWVVSDSHGYSYSGFKAFMVIFKHSPLFRWVTWFDTAAIRSVVLKLVNAIHSDHHHHSSSSSSGQPNNLPVRESEEVRSRLRRGDIEPTKLFFKVFINLLLIVLIVLCFGWNLDSMKVANPSTKVFGLGPLLGIDQHWGMFAPRPPDVDFWYVIEGNTSLGDAVELWKNEGMFHFRGNADINWDRPEPFHTSIGSHRWFKYYETYNQGNNEALRLAFGKFICREYNNRHAHQLHVFNVWVLQEKHNLDGTNTPLDKILLWGHRCY